MIRSCILILPRPIDVGKKTGVAKDVGFDADIALSPVSPFDPQLAEVQGTASAPIVAIDPLLFPADHALVGERPDLFRSPPDPRTPPAPAGCALAASADDTLADAVAKRLTELASNGIAGFVLANTLEPRLLDRIAKSSRESGAILIRRGSVHDARPGWADATLIACPAGVAVPTLANAPRPAILDLSEAGENALRLAEAAASFGYGLALPESWRERDDLLRKLRDRADAAAPFTGKLRALPSSPEVAAWLEPHPDGGKAALIAANLSDRAQPFPLAALQAAAPFAGRKADRAPLDPFETRHIVMDRTDPISIPAKRQAGAPSREAARLVLEDIAPSVDGGTLPAKRVVGDTVIVEATAFTDGHEQLSAELRWRALDEKAWGLAPMEQLPNDRWRAEFVPDRLGRYEFVVEAWLDRFGGFRRDFAKKIDADVQQPVDHAEGRQLVEEAAQRSKGKLATSLKKHLAKLEKAEGKQSADLLLGEDLAALMAEADERPHKVTSAPQLLDAERTAARFSSWYELFPRSMTDDKARHGTFADVIDHLPRVRDMGFDTLYFPPIHPIGKTNRKGPNNTLTPEDGDPGSPYAIGSAEGGHDAIHPELGTTEDFARLVEAAADHGLEIALDFAIQASPDHPWLKEHPGWFAWRPDGSMKYAENPPKKYQDIVNVDFYGPDAVPGLWNALRDVILLWVERGVKTFRVDNPHTKPLPFWEWMIADIRARHPEVIFLSEAFTRPTMMYRLAKVGFSQSYTYFTWRNEKQELIDYITELTSEAPKDFYRPHFFVNTPDINPHFLQTGGRPAHRIRAVLAATLSGLWGVYSGFELCDATPLGPGKEEYLDSEKFEIRPREWRSDTDIVDDITRLNTLRSAHPALQTHLNTRFYAAHDPNVIWYGKPEPDGSAMIMVMVNLDPHGAHACDFEVPLWEFGLGDDASIAVEDLFGGYRFDWHGKTQQIELTPDEPFRVWRLSTADGLIAPETSA